MAMGVNPERRYTLVVEASIRAHVQAHELVEVIGRLA
jgi:hypothetical protein